MAYSGEIDPQKASADLMEKTLAAEGMKLDRLIGPQTGHKYEPVRRRNSRRGSPRDSPKAARWCRTRCAW
jgi:hypothetical protein